MGWDNRSTSHSPHWKGGSTAAWRKIRLVVLNRDRWICQLGLEGCTGKANEVHHLRSRSDVGDDPQHLVASCRSCNLRAGDPSTGDPDPVVYTQW
jgi:5-methylcytosine-specific restriction endonuclease McrA